MFENIIKQLTFEEKTKLLTGHSSMCTYPVERLGIKSLKLADGPNGVRLKKEENCTLFPSLCCVGASWDVDIAKKMGEALAAECIEHGVDMLLAPGINIKRHILCGRNFEYPAEDPILAGEIAAAYIRGVEENGVGTSLKHFALNNQERYREHINIELDERTLREIYLKGFEIAVKKGRPSSVMCAYNKLYSIWCAENRFLLTDILRNEWGFDGFVISDWGAVHDICRSVSAGLDLQMPGNGNITNEIENGMKKGIVSQEDIDRAAERFLRFVMNKKAGKTVYNRESQHNIAAEIAEAGITLLKNNDCTLPLTEMKYKKIAVIGEFAQNPLMCGQGSAEVNPSEEFTDSPLDEIRKALPNTEIKFRQTYGKTAYSETMLWPTYADFSNFIADCDIVVLFIGSMTSEDTERFDRKDASFNPNYIGFVEQAKAMNKKTAVVIQSGSAMLVDEFDGCADAIVQMWLAGEASGKAVANILSGKVNPSGKLSETFPKCMRGELDYPGDRKKLHYREGFEIGYRYYDLHPEEIAYPFGHGLSYTEFKYSNCSVSISEQTINVSFDLENIGEYDGKEAAQVYVSYLGGGYSCPVKELKGFKKVFLKKNEKTGVTIPIDINELAYYNTALKKWITEPGRYKISVAASSQDIRLEKIVELEAPQPYTMGSSGESMIG